MAVYLLHSTVPLVRGDGREVRHYLGYCKDGTYAMRLHCHLANRHSAKIVQAFLANGGELHLGNYWPNLTREDERRMKSWGHIGNKCLICQINQLMRRQRDLVGTAIRSKPTLTGQS